VTQKQREKGKNNSAKSLPNSKQLKFTPPVMTPEQIKVSGEQAAQLLNSPIYNLAVNSVVEDLGQEILRSEPHEHNRREWLYTQGAAIGRMNTKLVEFVQLAQSLHMTDIAAEENAQHEEDASRGFASATTG